MTLPEPDLNELAWQARYRAARARLDSAERQANYAQLVAQVANGAPEVSVVAGALQVRAARRVGLLAGSYNPLTVAHVALAEAARVAGRLDLIAWALTAITIDKEQVMRASLPQRVAQMDSYHYATAGRDRYSDAITLINHGLYVDQARAVRTLMAPDAELNIIVGYDKIVQIFDPRYYDDREAALRALFVQARLLVSPRDGQGEADLRGLLAQPENQPYAHHVTFCPLDAAYAADSSTEARRIAARLSPAEIANSPELRRLLPPEGVALAATGAYAAQP